MTFTRIAGASLAFALLTSQAGAVMLAKLKSGGQPVLLCPKPTCPAVAAPQSAGMIAILEISGGFGRLSPYMTREEAATRYQGIDASRLPERVALWIDRRQVTTGDAAADEAAELEARKAENPKPAAKSEISAIHPVPQRAPRMVPAAPAAISAANTSAELRTPLPEKPAGNGLQLPKPPRSSPQARPP